MESGLLKCGFSELGMSIEVLYGRENNSMDLMGDFYSQTDEHILEDLIWWGPQVGCVQI